MPAPLTHIDDLTPGWLEAALGGRWRVRGVWPERIGVGEGFASRLYRLHPDYADAGAVAAGAPVTLILKLLTDNPELLRVLNPDMAYREARFYRDLGQHLARDAAQPVPVVHFADYDAPRRCFSILMEELAGLRFGFEATFEESEAAMRGLARIHAAYWRHPLLDEPWLQPVVDTEIDLEWLVGTAIAAAERSGWGQAHLTRAMRVLQPLVARLRAEVRPPEIGRSLCHGDFHRNNILLEPDGRFVIFDWQMLEAGNPLRDVGYWMLTSLTVAQRRAWQKRLLRVYHHALKAGGVRDYGPFALQQDFRGGMLENLVKVFCIPALVQADADLVERLHDRIEAASQDMHTIAVAHLFKGVLGLRKLFGASSSDHLRPV